MPVLNAAYKSLNDKFKPIVLEILTKLEAKGYQPIVAEGLRSVAQQQEKVKLGYSTTMHSYHLSGFAADIVDKRYMWNIPVSHQYWKDQGEIVEALKKTNPGLYWGGSWKYPIARYYDYLRGKTKYFMDVAHVELRLK